MTNASSLQELRKWLDVLKSKGIDKTEASIALVGSKGDLEHLRTVRLDNHSRFALEHNIPLSFLVSAKSGESVKHIILHYANKKSGDDKRLNACIHS